MITILYFCSAKQAIKSNKASTIFIVEKFLKSSGNRKHTKFLFLKSKKRQVFILIRRGQITQIAKAALSRCPVIALLKIALQQYSSNPLRCMLLYYGVAPIRGK